MALWAKSAQLHLFAITFENGTVMKLKHVNGVDAMAAARKARLSLGMRQGESTTAKSYQDLGHIQGKQVGCPLCASANQ